MKTKTFFLAVAVIAVATGFSSCKKDSSGSTTSPGTEAQTQTDDQTFYTNETDYATDDANSALDSKGGSYNARPDGIQSPPVAYLLWPCDTSSVVVDTTTAHSITINYSGSGCDLLRNHKRTGNIVISFNPDFKWGTAGASMTITFNLKIARISDNKAITITGTRVITNTTGGLLRNLASLDSVGYSVTDNTTILFDNGTQRTWQTSLHRTYSYNDGAVLTTTGSLAGTNRYGNSFSANITEPLVVEQCSDFRYTSGQVTDTGVSGSSVTTFGLDAGGNPTTGCQTGALYYKFIWTGPNGGSLTYNGVY